jgi:thiamine phosphate synthase YjbQ (UPF0047 family)
MKTLTEYLIMQTRKVCEYVNITGHVAKIVADSDIAEGMVMACMYTAHAVYLQATRNSHRE